MNAVSAAALTKRYGRRAALTECCIAVPEGSITALVGPNGAGKTTLLQLAAGLLAPSSGEVLVFGRRPFDDPGLIADVGFVAQDLPLYTHFSVRDALRYGRALNPAWDEGLARDRLDRVGVPFEQKIAHLSGGQRAQVALTLALGKRPKLLLLDEPLASLDPLARREFLRSVAESAADAPLTVVLSSHLISDLERVCDHLIVLAAGRTQVAGEISQLVEHHCLLIGPRQNDAVRISGVDQILERTDSGRQTSLLVRVNEPTPDPRWESQPVTLEDIVLGYLGQPTLSSLPGPAIAQMAGNVQ